MELALIIALACTAGSAERYDDYSSARMPDYHMHNEDSRDDYSERPSDISAPPLDYSYEDERRERAAQNIEHEREVGDVWHKERKKNKPVAFVEDYNSQDLYKYSNTPDEEHKLYARRRDDSNRLHNRRKKIDTKDELYSKNSRSRFIDEDVPYNDHLQGIEEDMLENKRDIKEKKKTVHRHNIVNNRKVKRRKTRNRENTDILDSEDVLTAEKVFDVDERVDNEKRKWDLDEPRALQPAQDDDIRLKPNERRAGKGYADYDQYNDMKRVERIKNKMPALLHRTTVREFMAPSARPIIDWPLRRAKLPDEPEDSNNYRKNFPIDASITKSSIIPKVSIFGKTTTNNGEVIITKGIVSGSSELSLAEKSKLSILKKAQRKEILPNVTITTKPPVLMLVTQRMQTMVMVEPPQSKVERLRPREISEDTPERIARAKKLMRHKLLSNAKNIHELINNWDDMVCDYIDVSLLNEAAWIKTPSLLLFFSYLSSAWVFD
ncbi:uncharacterized protein LOC126979056 [Leptidea sinapis]|uniref:uncharacterized protein LOC126979056 n=1 Tax=Leptidea sinapis TaxID=189913 RepID=UPI00214149AF|nr:uncharacterized protein LOC126979056 [Leptidea sinapis]